MNKDIIKLMTDDDILEGMRIHLKYEGFKEKTIDELTSGAQKILEVCSRQQLVDTVFNDNPEKAIRPFLDSIFPYMSFNRIGWYGVALRIMGSCLRKTASHELSEDDKKHLEELERAEASDNITLYGKSVGKADETVGEIKSVESCELSALSETDYMDNKKSIAAKKAARKLKLPFPKAEDAVNFLEKLKKDTDIMKCNDYIGGIVEKAGKENKEPEAVKMKVNAIITVCGPVGLNTENIAKQIIACHIDEHIENGSAEAVNILAGNLSDERQHDFYMFAVRYCAAHDPYSYPYYNAATVRALKFCRDNYGFYNFSNDELLNYAKYKKLLVIFKNKYSLDGISLSELSWLLTASGKLLAGK